MLRHDIRFFFSVIALSGLLTFSLGCGHSSDPGAPESSPQWNPDRGESVQNRTHQTIADPIASVSLPPNTFSHQDQFDEPHESDRLVVSLAAGQTYAQLEAQFGVTLLYTVGDYGIVLVPAGNDLKSTANAMVDGGFVDTAEPSAIYFLGNEVLLGFFESDPLMEAGISPDTHWKSRTDLGYMHSWVTGAGKKIAVLDSGIDEDLTLPFGATFANGGWDFVDGDDTPVDEQGGRAWGHGTLVADIALQVAPHASLLVYRVMSPDGAVLAVHVAEALHRAVEEHADVINLSFGGHASPSYVVEALQQCAAAGVVVVSSAGNAGLQDDKHFPSSSPYVCSVASTDPQDGRADFSNYGQTVEIATPGLGIVGQGPDRRLAVGVGTSFSAPMAAGAIACKMQAISMFPTEFRTALTNSSAPLLDDDEYRGGLIAGRIDFDAFFFENR